MNLPVTTGIHRAREKNVVPFYSSFPPIILIDAIDYHNSNRGVVSAHYHGSTSLPAIQPGTLYSMVKFAGLRDRVTSNFERSDLNGWAHGHYSSPITAFIENAIGH
ncbi:hypothetical protein BC827DRAFT_560236 [Russula dissimulans]|nr:hypothetical protein BC827DRAFT_560236 [Russula dissimulans]